MMIDGSAVNTCPCFYFQSLCVFIIKEDFFLRGQLEPDFVVWSGSLFLNLSISLYLEGNLMFYYIWRFSLFLFFMLFSCFSPFASSLIWNHAVFSIFVFILLCLFVCTECCMGVHTHVCVSVFVCVQAWACHYVDVRDMPQMCISLSLCLRKTFCCYSTCICQVSCP